MIKCNTPSSFNNCGHYQHIKGLSELNNDSLMQSMFGILMALEKTNAIDNPSNWNILLITEALWSKQTNLELNHGLKVFKDQLLFG